ncbi:hypothetical protein ACOSP7_009010 [Xanthoceras sorbifolium]
MESSSSSSSSFLTLKYDVFLSFRGDDTRQGFMSHLHAALRREEIKTFVDYHLRKGETISSSLLTAIEQSRISIVVFSKDYASSKWCLEELVIILESRKMYGQIVIPVFYGVDPSDVRKQTGIFGDAFAKHFEENSEKLQRWKAALTEAANFSGLESELVNKIVKDVLRKLERMSSTEEHGLVGVESKVKLIETFLCSPSNDVRNLFIVFDDVTNFKQIEYLFEDFYCLNLRSRIIITTRDKSLLTHRIVDQIYRVKELPHDEAQKLFKKVLLLASIRVEVIAIELVSNDTSCTRLALSQS